MSAKPPVGEVYSVEQVAEMLATTSVVIRSAIKAGKLHAFMVGREFRISRESLTAYIQQQSKQVEP